MHRSSLAIAKCLLLIVSLFLFTGCAALNFKAKADHTDEVANMDFVFVKGGTFLMGSDHRPNEQPIHSVTVQDLFVGMYEVTFDQYDPFCDATGREKPIDEGWGRGDRPVINVSWYDAVDYAEWLSAQTGHQYRLPSEAEWEYFARAGTTTAYWTGDTLPQGSANCYDCGSKWDDKMTAPVGSFAPSHWRIYDTSGNVQEWVLDDFQRSYTNVPTEGSPLTSKNSNSKVQRGGAWNYAITYLRSSARDRGSYNNGNNATGFRFVLTPSQLLPVPITQ